MSEGPRADGSPSRRLRWGALPEPPQGDVPWAKRRLELAGVQEAEHALLVQRSRAWQDVMVPVCAAIDADRSSRGQKFLYTSEELELALLFGRACGLGSYKETRAVLAGDDPRARQLLGFDVPRNRPETTRRMRLRDGVPSEATMSRHNRRITETRRRELWLEIERLLRAEHLADEDLQAESAVINLDGSSMLTHYTCPARRDSDEGPYGTRITCPDGGFVSSKNAPDDKRGHGWTLMMYSSASGVPLSWRLVPLGASEKNTALDLLREDFARDVSPILAGRLKVLVADGAFHKPELRSELHKHGMIESIHLCSHTKKAEGRARQLTDARYPIEGYENWFGNGHREVVCKCGRVATKKVGLDDRGRAIVRVQGKCGNCGTITVTAGDWRHTEDNRFVRTHPADTVDKRDWAFGNPLSFNDPAANVYGNRRFGHNEGLHGTLSTRYGLIRNKRWFRRKAQAEVATAMTFALIHAISMEQRRRVRQAAAPPGALAA
ncbi:MAG TPA: hypothetical protein VFA97_12850 [Gaiellaceae bacterium]|nr:hypothetical protein [Gaiellaceae bacterium]